MAGIFDAITGGSAQVWIEYGNYSYKPGDQVHAKVTVFPKIHFQANGVFIDLISEERGYMDMDRDCGDCDRFSSSSRSYNDRMYSNSVPLAGPLQFYANYTLVFEGNITIPLNAQPTYLGRIKHEWMVRGRVDAFGNDPDSGFKPIVVR